MPEYALPADYMTGGGTVIIREVGQGARPSLWSALAGWVKGWLR
jgi:hypothetical protein